MNASVDMGAFIAPKSDQLNADDLMAGPRTITVTAVRANEGSAEQPISINFEGDAGKPYKPCKSMRRVMVCVWGADAGKYVGRSMTLYCDQNVQFGGMKVGGIRISHMTNIDAAQTMALTSTRSKRAPFTVQPLRMGAAPAAGVDLAALVKQFEAAADQAAFAAAELARGEAWKALDKESKAALKAASDAAKHRLAKSVMSVPAAMEGAGAAYTVDTAIAALKAAPSTDDLNRIYREVQDAFEGDVPDTVTDACESRRAALSAL
jgi:hypothetical protein